MFIAVIILGILCAALAGALIWKSARSGSGRSVDSNLMLKADITELSKSMDDLRDGIQKQLTERLDKSNEQMVAQFKASATIIKDVTEKLTELDRTNKQVGDIAGELKTLQNVLQNPKQRGVAGEFYLESVLNNVLPPGIFQMQYKFDNGDVADAAIFLDKLILPIDSKFSLENYNRLVDEKDAGARMALIAEFKSDVKKRIDETSKYIRPKENTTDFAFMFIPSEAIYYDLLINKIGTGKTSSRDLIEYAFRDKKVVIVSPTTLLAYLQTVMQGLRAMKIEEQAKDIQQRVGDLGRHIGNFESYMQKLGNSLGTTVNHFNSAHKELKKVDKDVVKIAVANPSVEPMLLDRPVLDEE